MIKIIHQVWVQGADALPSEYAENRALWREAMPGWEMRLWSGDEAAAQWSDFAEVDRDCCHHAMRADLILARAQRDFGGLAMGTDVSPANPHRLRRFIEGLDCGDGPGSGSFVLANLRGGGGSSSNGLTYAGSICHPFWSCLCRHQLRDKALLKGPNIWGVTGPGCYWHVLTRYHWDLVVVPECVAYVRDYSSKRPVRPRAWVDPGYASSWHASKPGY